MGRFKYIVETSLIKSLRFNLHYFGLRGLSLPVLVSRNVSIRRLRGGVKLASYKTGTVRLGYSTVGIFDHVLNRAIWEVDGVVQFGSNVYMGQGFKVSVLEKGRLNVGSSFTLNANSAIVCALSIDIGKESLMSWDCLVMDTDFHKINGKSCEKPIAIGENVWIGCRSVLLKGAKIPDNCVVAEGSTVTKDLDVGSALYGGHNRLLRKEIKWAR